MPAEGRSSLRRYSRTHWIKSCRLPPPPAPAPPDFELPRESGELVYVEYRLSAANSPKPRICRRCFYYIIHEFGERQGLRRLGPSGEKLRRVRPAGGVTDFGDFGQGVLAGERRDDPFRDTEERGLKRLPEREDIKRVLKVFEDGQDG